MTHCSEDQHVFSPPLSNFWYFDLHLTSDYLTIIWPSSDSYRTLTGPWLGHLAKSNMGEPSNYRPYLVHKFRCVPCLEWRSASMQELLFYSSVSMFHEKKMSAHRKQGIGRKLEVMCWKISCFSLSCPGKWQNSLRDFVGLFDTVNDSCQSLDSIIPDGFLYIKLCH